MKTSIGKLVSLILNAMFCLSLTSATTFADYSVEGEQLMINGLIYQLDESGTIYEFTGVEDKNLSKAVLPTTINGLNVNYNLNWLSADQSPFSECNNLTEFYVEGETDSFYTEDGVLFGVGSAIVGNDRINGKTLLSYPTAKPGVYVIPEDTVIIGAHAFSMCTGLTSVTVPSNGIYVFHFGFEKCMKLETIYGNLQIEHASSIYTCTNLQSISFQGVMPSLYLANFPKLKTVQYGKDSFVQVDNEFGFENVYLGNCPKLETVILPNCVSQNRDVRLNVHIEDCESLQSLRINGLVDLNLENCPVLSEISIRNENSSDMIYDHAFHLANIPKLKTITFFDSNCRVEWDKSKENADANFIVYGYLGNTNLKKSCQNSDIPFQPITTQLGDLDGNGEIDLLDVITLNKNILGVVPLDTAQQTAADVNGDGSVDSSDSLLILQYTVHLVDSLGA